MMKPYIPILSCALLLFSCSKNIYSTSKKEYKKQVKEYSHLLKEISPLHEDTEVLESQNFSLRKPQFIIIHHTDQDSCKQTYRTFALKESGVSSHYVICEDGTTTQMLSDYVRGWHAGKGKWHSITDMNSLSLGIELDNNGSESFSESQINSLLQLLGQLTETYGIPSENIIGHSDWAPGRKVDPSQFFPWKKLADQGFGIWYDEDKIDDVELPDDFDTATILKLIGYDTSVLREAIYSFKLHFDGFDGTSKLTELDKKKLYLLFQEL